MSAITRIGVLTGGGDAPGLNAVIRAVVKSAWNSGIATLGIEDSFDGLLEMDRSRALTPHDVTGILRLGGTILGTLNTGNPLTSEVQTSDGTRRYADRVLEMQRRLGLDAVVAIGGDGTLAISHEFCRMGMPIVCVPKTIDNDVSGTQRTFGFDSAVSTATEALDKLHSTAESHERVLVVELMGRYAGWIALSSGLSGSADVILIPEIPFDIAKVCDKIRRREAAGRHFSIVVVAEGARPRDGSVELLERRGVGTVDRLGGIASKVARAIEHHTGKETRTLVLGHLQRGGTPTTYDRLLALRFGVAAVRAIGDRAFGTMVGLNGPDITRVPLENVVGRSKNVPLDSDTLQTARDLGISLGD